MNTHEFHRSVLREYDIRGIVGDTLHEADARAIGRAFVTMAAVEAGRPDPRIVVGFDGRMSSPALEAALVEGARSAGGRVVRIGRGPTPMLYYAVNVLEADGGIMVTGSHNPPTHNGFKMMIGKKSFYGEQIKALGRLCAEGGFASGTGSVEDISVFEDYLARLAGEVLPQALSVAWDAGNGATGDVLQALVKRLPGRHTLLNEVIDGTFPAHHPDPTDPANLVQLQKAVADGGLDLGIAFDGDGDRIGAVDGRGRIIWGDQLLAILAIDVLKERPGSAVIADVKASRVLFDEIARLGGQPVMWRTGHSLIKTKMAETGAPLAGEMSGHVFFADRYYGFDDALYAAVRLLVAIGKAGMSLAELRDRLPEMVNTPEMRFACDEERKFAVVEEVRDRLAAAGADVIGIDGVRVNTPDGWWLLRASNTQAVLVARAEASDQAGLERLRKQLAAELAASGVELPPEGTPSAH